MLNEIWRFPRFALVLLVNLINQFISLGMPKLSFEGERAQELLPIQNIKTPIRATPITSENINQLEQVENQFV